MRTEEVLKKLDSLSAGDRKAVIDLAVQATKDRVWCPNPGPQYQASVTEADELFYGGQAGGGKTDLGVGLALTEHQRTLVLRRIKGDAFKIVDRVQQILGTRDGYNGSDHVWRVDGRRVDFSGCEMEVDKQRFKGDPHDLIVFDEGCDFLESQYRFIIGWNRSANPKQRCRVLVTSNPPLTAEGLWVIKYWAPWLDPTHPNPAKPGELRWYTTIGEEDVEVDGPGPHFVDGREVRARSRTFIPSTLEDNPDLASTNYGSVLSAMPKEYRDAYRDGKFTASLRDGIHQLIPTAWIIAAQDRWTQDGWKDHLMTAMAMDPAGGGRDSEVIAFRHGGWYGKLIEAQGKQTADGERAAGAILVVRKAGCPIVLDMGGGYGGAVALRMKDNKMPYLAFNGAESSNAHTRDGKIGFYNKRAEMYWKFREALDPDQEGGSPVILPPDPELRSDLAAPTFSMKAKGILVESKDSLRDRLGRSTGKGDAVVMCWSQGDRAVKRNLGASIGRVPKVVMGHTANHTLLRRH